MAIAICITLFSIYFEKVDLSLYSDPIELKAKRTSKDSLSGIWSGIHYLQHDCNGCETKNQFWVSITEDSTVVMIEGISTFRYLFTIPILNVTYGLPKKWIVQTTEYQIRGNCIVELADTRANSLAIASQPYTDDYYQNLGCDLKPTDHPIQAINIQRKDDKLILTP